MTFPQNVASERRDIALARHIEEGTIRAWADGFGIWHAVVPVAHEEQAPEEPGFARPYEVARFAIRLCLQQRAPRVTHIDPPLLRVVSRDLEKHTTEYMEDTTRDQ